VIAVALLGTTAACGVATDETARPIESDIAGLLERDDAGESSPAESLVSVDITWVRLDTLVPTPRVVAASTPQQQLDASMAVLLAGPDAAERQDGLTTLLPPDLEVVGVVDGRRVVLDLTEGSALEPGQVPLAVGQLALTALDVPGVRSVTFAVNGEPARVPLPEGKPTRVIRESDYRSVVR
jgi:hypothetical protein